MADIAELGLKINSQPVEQAGAKLKNFGKIASDTERKVLQSTNGMATGFKSFNTSVKSAAPVVTTFEKTAKTATATSGNFSNSIRQISLQLSQVAQQGAVTGDFFRAFTVQLPDLLLGFGTFGILIGAVAGALGGPLIDALSGSSQALKDVDKDIEELTDGFEELTDKQRQYILLASQAKQTKLKEEFSDISEEINSAATNLKELEQGFRTISRNGNSQRITIAADPEEIQEAALALSKLEATRDNISLKLENEVKLQDKLKNATELATKAALEANRQRSQIDLASELDSTIEAIDRAGKTETQLLIDRIGRQKSILAESYSSGLIDFNQYAESVKQANANLQAELTEIDKKSAAERGQLLTNEQQATLGASAQFFGNLASIAQAGGEDQFQEYKNLASAQAAISAALAITSVLGDPLLPTLAKPPLAVSIGALAAVQIAQIQGQEYQSSRASGGQAKGRVLVGENGPEILNMGNSTGSITSAAGTKQELGGQTVQQVFNISPGLSGAIQAEMRAMLPLIKQVAISGVSSDIRNGGSTAKAVGIR